MSGLVSGTVTQALYRISSVCQAADAGQRRCKSWGSMRIRVTTAMCRARLNCRSPLMLTQWRKVFPDVAGIPPIDTCRRILGVTRQPYYKHKRTPRTPRQLRRKWLPGLIREVHVASRGTYG